MKLPKIEKPINPKFPCGPTTKPSGWDLKKLSSKYLGRYHRADDVEEFIQNQIYRIRKILKIPSNFKTFKP